MPESGSLAFFVVNLLMLQLRFFVVVANAAFTRFFCRECREYALFGVEFYTEFWQKFSEILRILAEILRKKMAGGASALDPLLFQKIQHMLGLFSTLSLSLSFWES